MQHRCTNFAGVPLTQAVGDGLRAQHKATEPLPPRWLELLAKLDAVLSAPTQPEERDGDDRSN
jgi:hypothetical protein